ncbi:MAG: TrkA family potassium uptake protein [Gemmatimonadota bacterium]
MSAKPKRSSTSLLDSWAVRFVAVAVYGAILVLLGAVGYALVEGWGFGDSLYMSVITLTAVGYQEVHPLTSEGRVLTMAMLGLGITWLGMWFALITAFLVELDLRDLLRKRRIMKEIESLSGHVILCGAGRTGRRVIEELVPSSETFVVIEQDPAHVAVARELAGDDLLVLEGDANHDATLVQAGIERASGLIGALGRDEDNVYVCLSARALNPDLTIVVRAYEEESTDKLYRAGADHVVSMNATGAVRMASVLLRPSVVSFLDVFTRSPDMALRVEQSTVGSRSRLNGKTLRDAHIRKETGLIVVAIRKGEGTECCFVFNPGADTTLAEGDDLIVLGTPDQIEALQFLTQG